MAKQTVHIFVLGTEMVPATDAELKNFSKMIGECLKKKKKYCAVVNGVPIQNYIKIKI